MSDLLGKIQVSLYQLDKETINIPSQIETFNGHQ